MPYRVTSTSPAGTSRTMTSDPSEALRQATDAVAEGRGDVWIADDEGHLFDVREFERFLNGMR